MRVGLFARECLSFGSVATTPIDLTVVRDDVHMAQAALTAQALAPGRFALGLGVEHDWVVRDIWGLPFERPVAEMQEYLRVVLDLIRRGFSQHRGDFYSVSAFLARLAPSPGLPVLLYILGLTVYPPRPRRAPR